MPRIAKLYTREIKEQIRQRYPQEGPSLLAEELGTTSNSVDAMASKLGLKSMTRWERRSRTLERNNKSVNVKAFSGSWTFEQAYLAGYIWSDGNVHGGRKLNFGCNEEDREVLVWIKQYLQSAHKLSRRLGGRKLIQGRECNVSDQVILQISSTYLVKEIMRKARVEDAKSYKDLPLPIIPESVFRHFVRGEFDGDGGIGTTSHVVYYLGTESFIRKLHRKLIESLELTITKVIQLKETTFAARWGSRRDVRKLYYYMYPPGNYPYLSRKRKIFEEVWGSLLV